MRLYDNADANPIPAGITPRMSRGRKRGKPDDKIRPTKVLAKKLVDSLLAAVHNQLIDGK